jgi:TolB-like protein/class 3 adenylate cyclase/Flp pilus assembly protein TadD
MSVEAKHRRLAAIMFTDMVGYSALTQKDESLALDLLDESRRILRPVFKIHHGKEIETVGDAFFVEFPSALDGARCAVAIQEKLHKRNSTASHGEKIRLRIGLHLGDVVQRGRHVHGDGVNIAARIEPLASPGGICVSEDIARQVQNKLGLPLARLGRGELKNIDLPVDIFRVVLSWEHEASPWRGLLFGRRRKRLYAVGAAVVTFVIVLALLVPFTSQSKDVHSIAVLPFQNLSGVRENEYFTDGITEDVIAQLSKIGNLRVISRTSMMQYKNTGKQMHEIGRELNVSAILEGSIRREEDSVRIVATLVDAETGDNLWGGTYDEAMTHIFGIQRDVATKIAGALKAKISPSEQNRLESKKTENVNAYDLYLRGRYYWNKRLPDDLKRSISYFQQALSADSTFALAYAGLADAFVVLGDFSILAPRETYLPAKAAAVKAIGIDDGLSEVHTSYAYTLMHYDWDWSRAEEEFKRAIELNPSNSRAHSWYGLLLAVTGRFDESTAQGQLAFQLDPLSPAIRTDAGLAFYFSRRYDEAIAALKGVLQLDPTFVVAYLPLGGSYVQKGMSNEALAAFSQASMMSRGHPIAVAALGHAYSLSGMKDDAVNMLELLEEKVKIDYVASYWKAVAHLGVGQNRQTLALLEQALAEHDGSLIFLNVDPVFDSLRSDPRFVALVERMKLPHTQSTL